MSIEEAIMGGIVFKGKKDKPKEEEKVKTKAKKATYIRGQHGSGAAEGEIVQNISQEAEDLHAEIWNQFKSACN